MVKAMIGKPKYTHKVYATGSIYLPEGWYTLEELKYRMILFHESGRRILKKTMEEL
jgi:hypothetical protein